MYTKKETLTIKWWPNALTTIRRGAQIIHQPLDALESLKETISPVFSYTASCVVCNHFTTWGLLPRNYGIPITIPTTVFSNIRFMLCSQLHASVYKQHLSMVKAKDNLPAYVTLKLKEVKSCDQACEHTSLDHVLTGQWWLVRYHWLLKHTPTLE